MELLNDIEILIVEDNPNDAEMALRAFKKNNLTDKVFVVNDGQQAIDFVFAKGKFSNRDKRSQPKIILLDLQLPNIDGLEVLKTIRSNSETKIIPIIILTSSKEESDIIKSYQLGVNSYIVKPVDFSKFVEAMHNLGLYWLMLNQHPQL